MWMSIIKKSDIVLWFKHLQEKYVVIVKLSSPTIIMLIQFQQTVALVYGIQYRAGTVSYVYLPIVSNG